MSRPRCVAIALLAVAAVGIASGCAGDSGPSLPEFEQAVVSTRDRVDFSLEQITTAESKEELLALMEEAADNIDDAASDLSAVGSPERFADETTKLVDSLHALSVDLSSLAADAARPEGEALLAGGPGLNFPSWDEANSALSALSENGVQVEPLARH